MINDSVSPNSPNKSVDRGRRRGATSGWPMLLAAVGCFAILGCSAHSSQPKPLVVYCAAALKAPMEEIAAKYQQETGVPVQLQFGASNSLLTNAEISRVGDLYLPADDTYLEFAAEKKLLAERIPLARLTLVLAVHKGNPKMIHSLEDVLNGDVKVAQANPDAAAVGRLARAVLQENGLWDRFEKRTIVVKPTVNSVASDIALGSVDAGIVWDVTVKQYPELEAVEAPLLSARPAQVAIGVLTTSEQPAAALRFARYAAATDGGLVILSKMGYAAPDAAKPGK